MLSKCFCSNGWLFCGIFEKDLLFYNSCGIILLLYSCWLAKEVTRVKKGIHPQYQDAKIICACGEVIETKSTKPEIKVEICSKCHPFYTGKQKLVDTGGRVDRFNKRFNMGK